MHGIDYSVDLVLPPQDSLLYLRVFFFSFCFFGSGFPDDLFVFSGHVRTSGLPPVSESGQRFRCLQRG